MKATPSHVDVKATSAGAPRRTAGRMDRAALPDAAADEPEREAATMAVAVSAGGGREAIMML